MVTDLPHILEQHRLWLIGDGSGVRASLRCANLSDANLIGANLSGAKLSDADLSGANLSDANLIGAKLSDADLSGANLRCASLSGANLSGANLRCANLSGANLRRANLSGADLSGANLPDFSVCPDVGSFTGWKKLVDGHIARLLIPEDASRTSSLVGRKCRAEFVQVVSITGADGVEYTDGISKHDGTVYTVGEVVFPDSYNDDIRVECTNGIHFFITRAEAVNY